MRYLYEEFLGKSLDNYYDDYPTGFYKNPISIKNMPIGIRGISNKVGDLFICDNPNYVHRGIGKWLIENNFLNLDSTQTIYDHARKFNVLLWEKRTKYNNFYLSDSSENALNSIIGYELEDFLPLLKKMYQRLKQKNPQYEFYFYYSPMYKTYVDDVIKRK
jgi:hypothetical protein